MRTPNWLQTQRRLGGYGRALVSKRLKLSNDSVEATGRVGVWCQPRKRKANFAGSTGKISHFGPRGAGSLPARDRS